jgi:hypothetical protein
MSKILSIDDVLNAIKDMRETAYRQGWADAMKSLRKLALTNEYNSPLFGGTTTELEKIGFPSTPSKTLPP